MLTVQAFFDVQTPEGKGTPRTGLRIAGEETKNQTEKESDGDVTHKSHLNS